MFERYTLRARRLIFFARYEATETRSREINTEHLLLSFVRECPALVGEISDATTVDGLRAELFPAKAAVDIPTYVDIPLAETARRVLTHAREEADWLHSQRIVSGHLLLGLMREAASAAAKVFEKYAVTREKILERMPQHIEEGRFGGFSHAAGPPASRKELHDLLDRLPENALSDAKLMLEGMLEN